MSIVSKEYSCPECGEIEITQLHNKISKKCPTCSSPIERLIGMPLVSKLSDPRTVGSQIELNNRKNPLTREKHVGGSDVERRMKRKEEVRRNATMTPEQRAADIRRKFG